MYFQNGFEQLFNKFKFSRTDIVIFFFRIGWNGWISIIQRNIDNSNFYKSNFRYLEFYFRLTDLSYRSSWYYQT